MVAEVEEVRDRHRGEGLMEVPRKRRLMWAAVLSLALLFGFYVHPLLPLAALILFYLDWRRWRRRGVEIEVEA